MILPSIRRLWLPVLAAREELTNAVDAEEKSFTRQIHRRKKFSKNFLFRLFLLRFAQVGTFQWFTLQPHTTFLLLLPRP
jgi:hypothetical protein